MLLQRQLQEVIWHRAVLLSHHSYYTRLDFFLPLIKKETHRHSINNIIDDAKVGKAQRKEKLEQPNPSTVCPSYTVSLVLCSAPPRMAVSLWTCLALMGGVGREKYILYHNGQKRQVLFTSHVDRNSRQTRPLIIWTETWTVPMLRH